MTISKLRLIQIRINSYIQLFFSFFDALNSFFYKLREDSSLEGPKNRFLFLFCKYLSYTEKKSLLNQQTWSLWGATLIYY